MRFYCTVRYVLAAALLAKNFFCAKMLVVTSFTLRKNGFQCVVNDEEGIALLFGSGVCDGVPEKPSPQIAKTTFELPKIVK